VSIGRTLIALGIVILALGVVLTLGEKLPIRFGRSPGHCDSWQKFGVLFFRW